MGEEKQGVQNLEEALDLALTSVEVGRQIAGDGKVSLPELLLLLKLVPKVGPALKDLDKVPSELQDLSAEEALALSAMVVAKLKLPADKAGPVLEKGLKAIAAVYDLAVAIKASQA